jgi:hypothetical protein
MGGSTSALWVTEGRTEVRAVDAHLQTPSAKGRDLCHDPLVPGSSTHRRQPSCGLGSLGGKYTQLQLLLKLKLLIK